MKVYRIVLVGKGLISRGFAMKRNGLRDVRGTYQRGSEECLT